MYICICIDIYISHHPFQLDFPNFGVPLGTTMVGNLHIFSLDSYQKKGLKPSTERLKARQSLVVRAHHILLGFIRPPFQGELVSVAGLS